MVADDPIAIRAREESRARELDALATIKGQRLTVLIANAHRLLRLRYRNSPLWGLVSDLTGYGSTSSAALCRAAGYDPHQQCRVKILKGITP